MKAGRVSLIDDKVIHIDSVENYIGRCTPHIILPSHDDGISYFFSSDN